MRIILITPDRETAWAAFRDLEARGIQVGFPSLGADERLGGYAVQTAAPARFCARALRAKLARLDRAAYVAAYEAAEEVR